MMNLVLLRHGESIWNKENKFTGWVDIDLSKKGKNEAKRSAKLLKEKGYTFDVAYTSYLKRAIRTLWIVLDEMDLMWIPVYNSWRLNERHYGGLQGLNKAEMGKEYGEEQVHIWRRSYDIRPPALKKKNTDRRYDFAIPKCESLKDTVKRVIPYWKTIAKEIKHGKKVIIAAHGNSLRALVKYLDNIPDKDIPNLNIPTGIPLVYELNNNLKPIRHYYLGDKKALELAICAVAAQGGSKQ